MTDAVAPTRAEWTAPSRTPRPPARPFLVGGARDTEPAVTAARKAFDDGRTTRMDLS